MSREEIFEKLSSVLQESFEIKSDAIRPDARLREDLDLDSIDAVDLMVQFRPIVGKKLQPEVFKSVKTVDDVVNAMHDLMNSN